MWLMHALSARATAVSTLSAVVLAMAVLVMIHPGPIGFDRSVAADLISTRTSRTTTVVADASDLASPLWVGVWTVLLAAVFALRDRGPVRAGTVLAAVATAGAVAEVLKLVVDRPRPPTSLHPGIAEMTYSFPSGHVTGACALVMTTAVLVRGPRWLRGAAVVAGLVVTGLAAATRLYLGVHWLSDVFAAAAVGITAALTVPPLVTRLAARTGVFPPSTRRPPRGPHRTGS